MRFFPYRILLPHSMRVFFNLPSQRGPCVRKAAQARTGFWIRDCFRGMQTPCSPSVAVFCGHHSNNLIDTRVAPNVPRIAKEKKAPARM